jgi:VanZ family protein
MWQIFSQQSPYKKRARLLAILWTLLIFILCFMPAKDVPNVDFPLADKWVHFVLFGTFAFLWLCSRPSGKISHLLIMLAASIITGWLVEELQGMLPSLGRNKDVWDIVADSIGGILGIALFYICSTIAVKKRNVSSSKQKTNHTII